MSVGSPWLDALSYDVTTRPRRLADEARHDGAWTVQTSGNASVASKSFAQPAPPRTALQVSARQTTHPKMNWLNARLM